MRSIYLGKTALITGASAGIGLEFSKQLHAAGSKVILVARRGDRLHELSQQLNAQRPQSAVVEIADLTKEPDLYRIATLLREQSVDILVNNAGRGSFGPFDELTLKDELEMVALNVTATIVLAHAVLPHWKKNRFGVLFGISSIASMQPLPYMATYSATKSFNFNHTVGLWGELRKFGIYATAVCPGPTATEFGGVARVPGTFSGGPRDSVELVVRQSLKAAADGRPFVVPGLRSWFMSVGSRFCPTSITTSWVEGILGKLLKHR